MGRKKTDRFLVPEKGSQEEKIVSMCEALDFKGLVDSFKHIATRVNSENGTIHDFFESLLEKEMYYREEQRILSWVQQARFPFQKTIEDFDFSFQPTINERSVRELASCRFVEQGENIVLLGPPGVGKTHLSIALGLEAIDRGYDAKFIKLNDFIERAQKETGLDSSSRLFKQCARPRLVIFDDIDFFETEDNVNTMLFKIICQRYDNKLSTIFTSNRLFDKWGGLFGNRERAGAALDRIIERATIISINGNSYRVKDKVKRPEAVKVL